jgi:hypothetical protein
VGETYEKTTTEGSMRRQLIALTAIVALGLLLDCGPAQLTDAQAAELIIVEAGRHAFVLDVPVGDVAFVHRPDAGEDFPAARTMAIARHLRDANGYLDFAACTEIRSGFYRIRANRQCRISLTDPGEIAFGRVPDVTIDPGVHLVEAQHWLRPTVATTEIDRITAITPTQTGAEAAFQWRWVRTEFGEATAGWDGLDSQQLREGRALLRLESGAWLIEEINW